MRLAPFLRQMTIAATALLALAACSQNQGSPGMPIMSARPFRETMATFGLPVPANGAARGFALHRGLAAGGSFSQAAFHSDGAMGFFSDYNNNVVYITTAQGATTATVAGFSGPDGMSIDKAGDLYVANNLDSTVFELVPPYNGRPTVIEDPGQAPVMVAVDRYGNLAVTSIFANDGSQGLVALYTAGAAAPTSTLSAPNFYPYFCAFDARGNLYVDGEDFSTDSTVVGEIAGGVHGTSIAPLRTGNEILFAGGVQVTAAGDIAIGDQYGHAIYTYHPPSGGSLGNPISTTSLSDAGDPVNFALSAHNHVIAVADAIDDQGEKYAYPAGGSPLAVTRFFNAQPVGVAINPTGQYARI